MDFVVQKVDLLRELQYVQGVIEKRATMPILSNVLLEATSDGLLVTATDLDVTVRCTCAAAVKDKGAQSVSARKLFDIVRLLPDAEIHFRLTDERLRITCQRSRFKVACLGKKDFPDIPLVDGERVELPASLLRYMIARCIFAITQEESRFALNGALMIIKPRTITFVTTDGHRLALISRRLEVPGLEEEIRNLVPRKTLVELSKLASEADAKVAFSRDERHLLFQVGDRVLISRMLSGQFPDYEMVLPKDNQKVALLSTSEFIDALRRVAVMADAESRAVKFALTEGQLQVSSNNPDYGEASDGLAVQYEDTPLNVCFNVGYVLDFLTGLESDQIRIELADEETQGLFQPAEEGAYDYRYVVMPMKL